MKITWIGKNDKCVSSKGRKMSLGTSVGFCMMWLKNICYKDGNSPDLEDVKMSLRQGRGKVVLSFKRFWGLEEKTNNSDSQTFLRATKSKATG